MSSSASKRHHPPPVGAGDPAPKRPKAEASSPTKSTTDHQRVELNPADCDLDFDIEANGLQGSALHEKGFAYCWSGARATVGITGGKYCFGCKIVSEQLVDMSDTPVDQQHLARVGISRGDDSVGCLGETVQSFGFGGTGKFSSAGRFSEYGVKFGVGDTIVCAVDLENKPLATIGFCVNGKWLGIAKEFDASVNGLGVVGNHLKKLPWDSALFPHCLLKNVVVHLQFSISNGLEPKEGYKPWNSAIEDGNAVFGPTFSSPECEVLMMVGLPASGKTTWAEQWVKEHPEKRYVLLGTNLALDSMKVPGLLRKHNYGERFERLMNCATGIFNTLLARAAKTPRNYILDQTNVYKSARNRKLKSFVKYRKIAVVVFPRPEDLKLRAAKRFEEMGKEVPAEAVNEMIANYVLPTSKDMPGSTECFDEVIFLELARDEAQRQLDEMKRALTSNLNTKHGCSSYSNESSVQTFPRQLVANKEPTTGHLQTPQSKFSYSYYSSPSKVSFTEAIPRPTFSTEHPPRAIDTHQNVPSDNPCGRTPTFSKQAGETIRNRSYEDTLGPYQRDDFRHYGIYDRTPTSFQRSEMENYGNYDRTVSLQRSEFDRQSMCSGLNPYERNSYGRSSTFGEMSPYQRSRSTDLFPRPEFESSSPISRPYGYLSTPSYGGPDGLLHDPGVPRVTCQPSMTGEFEWRPHHISNESPYAAAPPPRPSPGARGGRPPMDYWPPLHR